MEVSTMKLLVEVVDTLVRLDKAVKGFCDTGYYDNFDKLNNVYEVIKRYSIFKDVVSDNDYELYDLVEDNSLSAQKRAEILLGIIERYNE